MPQIKSVVGGVDTFMLPGSHITISMRSKANGRDKAEAMQACLGEGFNARHAYTRYLGYMAALLMVSWDATKLDADTNEQVPVPISPQTLAAMDDEDDYDFLMGETSKRVTLREAANPDGERNFDKSSTPSSAETSLTTPETPSDSSTS